jgi:hypothetical protein
MAQLGHLPFPTHMTALADLARSLDEDAYRALHATLDAGDRDQRHAAFFVAAVRRDLAAVAAALHDPVLRSRAMSAAVRLPVPDEALAAVALSPIPGVRHDAFRVLRLSRRRSLADLLLPRVHDAHGPAEAARLLPACSPAAVAAWCGSNAEHLSLLVLFALARTAPAAVAALLADAHASPAAERRLRVPPEHAGLVTLLSRRDASAALLLAERAPDLLTPDATRVLMRTPEALMAAAERGGARQLPLRAETLPRRARRALRRLSPSQTLALAELCVPAGQGRPRGGSSMTPDPLLLLVPAHLRRGVMAARGERSGRRTVASTETHALAALAPAERAEVVRPRVWAHPRRALIRWCPLLPLPEAEPLLRERAAMAALRNRLDALPEAEALALLAPLAADTRGPVGTRKQAARALAAMPGRMPWEALLAAWDAPGQHHDVLAVLVSPLAARMGEAGVAERLAAAVHHPAVMEPLAQGQQNLPDAARGPYARFLATQAASAPSATAAAACRALRALPGGPGSAATGLTQAATDPQRAPAVREMAAGLLLEHSATELPSVLAVLATQAANGAEPAARGERARPGRAGRADQAERTSRRGRALRIGSADHAHRAQPTDPTARPGGAADSQEIRFAAVRVLKQLAIAPHHDTPVPALELLADALDDAGLRGLAARVSFDAALSALLAGDAELARWRRCLARAGDRPGRLALAGRHVLPFDGTEPSPAVAEVAVVLAAGPAPAAGAIALSLTRAAGTRTRWATPWPAVLHTLTTHPDPEIAESALLTAASR